MLRSCILVILLCCTLPVFSATIRGDIKDAKDSSAVTGVTVIINSINRNAATDINGHYELIDIPDGSYEIEYSYVSFKTEKRTVIVSGGTDATVNIVLTGRNNTLRGASVKATRVTKTESAVVLEMKKSSVAVSGISAAQISKTQDRNAADVVKRIPGVTIQDDRFIVVRGLGERYNAVWLNDASAPSSEIDKKAFSFDLIPSGLIDRILIFKTPAADLPGDFAGGMAKIYTSSIPAKTEYNFAIQGSYRSGSTGTNFNYEPRKSGDLFGYDNGSRNLPAIVPNEIFDKTNPNITAITKAFANDWVINTQKQKPDLRVSGSAANVLKAGGGVTIGNTFGINYSNTSTNYNVQRYDWEDTTKEYHYNDQESINKVNASVLENIAMVIGNSKIEWKNLYNQIARSVIIERTNVQDSDLIGRAPNLKAYLLGYDNRRTYASELSGTHHNDKDTRKYNWTLGYSSLLRNQPDLRRLQYVETNTPGEYSAQVQAGVDINYGGGRYYGNLNEKIYSLNHQFTQKIVVDSNRSFDISLGNYVEYKKRSFSARELGYTIQPGPATQDLKKLPIGEIFSAENVGDADKFKLEDNTHPYDTYSASNMLIASYLSINAPIGNRIKALAGVRFEHNEQKIDAFRNLAPVLADVKTNFLLPSINLTYNFTSKMLLRLAYGKTLNRPEFREAAPVYFYDFSLNAGTYGALYEHTFAPAGDTLKVAEVQNIDARWEFYPASGEMIHAGIFYKSFKNPIQQVYVSGLERSFTFANGKSAYVAGIEIDVRKNLIFLDDKFGGHVFKGLTLVGNLSLSKSELHIDSSRITNAIPKGPLQNQSNYVVNAGLFYQNDGVGMQGSLLYNVYGPRLFAVGIVSNGSLGELAFHSLDFTIAKSLAKHYSFMFGIQNLLGQSVRIVEDINLDSKFDTKVDKPYTYYKVGQYFTVGLKMHF